METGCVLLMKKKLLTGLIGTLLLLITISPVAAYTGDLTIKMKCDTPICPGSEFECTVQADYSAAPGVVESVLVLAGTEENEGLITSASDGGVIFSDDPSLFASWVFPDVQDGFSVTRTVTIKPRAVDNNLMVGRAGALAPHPDGDWEFVSWVVDELVISDACPSTVPEFPSVFLPAIFIIGMMGAVLVIRRTREH